MKKIIPLHSLVITVGPGRTSRRSAVSVFPTHEVLDEEGVRTDLVGDRSLPPSVVFDEIRRRAKLKLGVGERVVIEAPNLRRTERLALASMALSIGIPVFYLLCADDTADDAALDLYYMTIRDASRGDGVAEVIDAAEHDIVPVSGFPADPLPVLRSTYSGITAFGDIHGMHNTFLTALSWARSRNHFCVFLGDAVSYGPGSLEVVDEIHRVVARGGGVMLRGNHERKIERWLWQNEQGRVTVRLSEGNRVVTKSLIDMDTRSRNRWVGRFRGLMARAPHRLTLGNVTFTHAAVWPGVWTGDTDYRQDESYALFGEFDATSEVRAYTHRWVSHIPDGHTVIVGHEMRSNTHPVTVGNDGTGTTIFLDTGCGKGGPLSTVDLKFTDDGLRVENFNVH